MGKSTISMVIFNSYVSLPEGTSIFLWFPCGVPIKTSIFLWKITIFNGKIHYSLVTPGEHRLGTKRAEASAASDTWGLEELVGAMEASKSTRASAAERCLENHRKTMGKWMYTLWLCQNSYWTWPSRNSGFSQLENCDFPIVMLVYQRVNGLICFDENTICEYLSIGYLSHLSHCQVWFTEGSTHVSTSIREFTSKQIRFQDMS